MTVAETVCSITRSRGATEAAMVDHDMAPMTKVSLFNFCSFLFYVYV